MGWATRTVLGEHVLGQWQTPKTWNSDEHSTMWRCDCRWIEQTISLSCEDAALETPCWKSLCHDFFDFIVLSLYHVLGPVQAELDAPMAYIDLLLQLLDLPIWHGAFAVPELTTLAGKG